MKKLTILFSILLTLTLSACGQKKVTGVAQSSYDSLQTKYNNLESIYSDLQITNNSLQLKITNLQQSIDSLQNDNNANCDSLGYYINLAEHYKLSYEQVSPYGKDGYNIEIDFTDTNAVDYRMTQLDSIMWLKVSKDSNEFNMQIVNSKDIRFWYMDSTKQTQLLLRYNPDWFK